MTKVSVIIPIYNEEKVIKDCIDSLNKQSLKDIQIIVVDDGSTDNSAMQVENLGIKTLKQFHKGAGAARNFGAKEAKGEILVFVDADMIFEKDFVKNLIKPIIERNVVGTFSRDEYLENKNNWVAKAWNLNRGLPIDRMHTQGFPEFQEVFRAIKKSAFEKVGGFDEKLGYTDDWSLSQKLGVKAQVATDAIFYHKNPETLGEVFIQSRWMAKRKYKFGTIGYLFSLLRTSLLVSMVIGILKSIKYSFPEFLVFKIVSDIGSFIGILEYAVFGKVSK